MLLTCISSAQEQDEIHPKPIFVRLLEEGATYVFYLQSKKIADDGHNSDVQFWRTSLDTHIDFSKRRNPNIYWIKYILLCRENKIHVPSLQNVNEEGIY